MFLCDYHSHTSFSFDGAADSTPDSLCRRALEMGLHDLAITDHCEMEMFTDRWYTPYPADEAFRAMKEAQETYRGRLRVLCGVELGNAHHAPDTARKILSAHPYDFVIGSLHNLRTMPDFCAFKYDILDDVQINGLFSRMLDETEEMCRTCGDLFHTLGHLTYIHRYLSLAGKSFSFDPYLDRIEALFRLLIGRHLALEVNISTLWKGLGFTMPTLSLLKLYRDCGGQLITIGSDAHSPVNLARNIRQGYALLEAAGFDRIAVMRDGELVLQPFA